MDVDELRAAVRANVHDLRQRLAKEEVFLAELEARVPAERAAAPTRRADEAQEPAATAAEVRPAISRGEKKQRVWALIQQRPGRWTAAEMRDALRDAGIADPDAGTPVKNVLWLLAKEGKGDSLGGGAYDFPAERVEEDSLL